MQANTARKRFGSYFAVDLWGDTPMVTEMLGEISNLDYEFFDESDAIKKAVFNHTESLSRIVKRDERLAGNSKILLFRYNMGWYDEAKMERIKKVLADAETAKTNLAEYKDVAKVDVTYLQDGMKIAADLHVDDEIYVLKYNHILSEGIRTEVVNIDDVRIYDNRNVTSSNPREDLYDFNLQYSAGNYGFDLMDTKDGLEDGEIDISHHESKAFRTAEQLEVFRNKIVKQFYSKLEEV